MILLNWIKEHKELLFIILVATIIRFYKLDYQSPWGDELFTMINTTSDKSFIQIFDALKNDVHPPLYYYIVHFFNILFGDTCFVARAVSVFFGIAGMFSIYYLAKELINKKVGIISVLLMSVNYFHIYHSQEARMYSMLFFTTTISFYFLIKFIKKPTLKTALLHSFFACIMIYTHFFALFTLFSQYLILLYFILKPYQISQKKFFLFSFLSGIVTAILYIPSLIIFFTASKRDSFWILLPEKDVYTQMIKEFFGFSEVSIMIAVMGIIFFFIKLFNRNEYQQYAIDPKKEKQVFSFFILFVWIIITLIIPLAISFINLPMIVSRYFINILPAIIILIATGLYYIKNNLVKATLVFSFVLFSYADVVIVKAYYRGIMKTQYREVCQYVKSKHNPKEPIYSSFEYYMSYYLKASENHPVIKETLNKLAENSLANPNEIKPFWYLDINNTPDKPTDNTNKILDSLYVVDDNIALFDCYAKHYQPKSTYKPNVDLSKFVKPYKDRNGDSSNSSIEIFNENDTKIEISGWIYFENQSTDNVKIHLLLINENDELVLNTESISRTDVTSYFKSKYDLSRSGFKTELLKENFKAGLYKVGIYIRDSENKKEALIVTDKKVTII